MHVAAAGRTHPGLVRTDNDNAVLSLPEEGVFLVVNGNSGAKGAVASEILIEVTRERTEAIAQAFAQEDDKDRRARTLAVVRDLFAEASRRIFARAEADPELHGMSCSGTLVAMRGTSAVIGHVGHNSVYHVRGSHIQRLTVYHTVAEELLRQGQIKAVNPSTTEHAYVLMRAVGMFPSTQTDTLWIDLAPGDALVLCTKGITQHLEPDDIATALIARSKAADAVDRLVELANERGGEDNIAVVVARLLEGPEDAGHDSLCLDSQARMLHLRQVSFFQFLTFEEMLHLLKIVYDRRCEPGELIVEEGTTGAELYFVAEGTVDVSARGIPLTRLEQGQVFGELSFVDGSMRSASVRASRDGPVTLLRVSRDDLNNVLTGESPQVAAKLFWSMCQSLARRLRELTDDFVDVSQAFGQATGPKG